MFRQLELELDIYAIKQIRWIVKISSDPLNLQPPDKKSCVVGDGVGVGAPQPLASGI